MHCRHSTLAGSAHAKPQPQGGIPAGTAGIARAAGTTPAEARPNDPPPNSSLSRCAAALSMQEAQVTNRASRRCCAGEPASGPMGWLILNSSAVAHSRRTKA